MKKSYVDIGAQIAEFVADLRRLYPEICGFGVDIDSRRCAEKGLSFTIALSTEVCAEKKDAIVRAFAEKFIVFNVSRKPECRACDQ